MSNTKIGIAEFKFKPEDLRIGSYVEYVNKNGNSEIQKMTADDIFFLGEFPEEFNRLHKPIPITPEVLPKFEFRHYDESETRIAYLYYRVGDFMHVILNKENKAIKPLLAYKSERIECEYIHELQDLVRLIFKVEIEYKP